MELFIFPAALNCTSASPFSMKTELLLRMMNIEHKVTYGTNPGKGPNGKLPYLVDGDKTIADSHYIYQHAKQKFNTDLDSHLTPEQKATSLSFTRLCEDHLYWCEVYSRWVDPAHNHHIEAFFTAIPWGIRQLVIRKSRKTVAQAVYHQGIGRHSVDKIYQQGCDDISAIATHLAQNAYFMGDKVSSVDAIIYGILAAIVYPDIATPMKAHLLSLGHLTSYLNRIEAEFNYSPPKLK